MKKLSPVLFLILFLSFNSCTKYRNEPSKYGGNFVAPTSDKITFGSLRINEFLIKGTDPGAVALFGGATAKWFELYNPTSADITLTAGQWFVTDDLTDPTKFAITRNSGGAQWKVPAKGFLAIMCVKLNSTTPAPGKINTDFSLSSSTGDLGVFYQENPSAAFVAVDTLHYDFGAQEATSGVSYGRRPDGQDPINPLPKVTPEASNN